jgi:hypothetical protein
MNFDWMSTEFQELLPACHNQAFAKPFFSAKEGSKLTVDCLGRLHIFSVIEAGMSMDTDSLAFTFTPDNYQGLMFDVMYDPYYQVFCSFKLIDTLYSRYPSGIIGDKCYSENVWTSGLGKMNDAARLQISRSEDGYKIFYIWTDTDTAIANFCNSYPNIYIKGYDIDNGKYTKTFSVSDDMGAFHMFACSEALTVNGQYKIGMTITKNSSTNADSVQYTYFINNAIISDADFNQDYFFTDYLNSHSILDQDCPVGIKENSKRQALLKFTPNPFVAETETTLELSAAAIIELQVYNSFGSIVLKNSIRGHTGTNTIKISGHDLPVGIYFYKVNWNDFVANGKLLLYK